MCKTNEITIILWGQIHNQREGRDNTLMPPLRTAKKVCGEDGDWRGIGLQIQREK
jgi:hypothetical protein